MIFKSTLFTINFLLFYIQYEFQFANAMIGQNVRLANEGEYTYVVSIKAVNRIFQYEPEKNHLCTGTLVSPRDIITLSRALQNIQLHEFEIIFGSTNLRIGIKMDPKWWITYSEWVNRNRLNAHTSADDIALIRVISDIPETIQPIVILPLAANALYGVSIEVVGWSRNISGDMNQQLEVGTLTIQTDEFCINRMQELIGIRLPVFKNLLCSIADPFLLATSGSNGGPVIYMNTLVAIHNGIAPVTDNLNPRKLNYHIAIESFAPFIVNNINQQ